MWRDQDNQNLYVDNGPPYLFIHYLCICWWMIVFTVLNLPLFCVQMTILHIQMALSQVIFSLALLWECPCGRSLERGPI